MLIGLTGAHRQLLAFDAHAEEVLRQCSTAMAPPVKFKITASLHDFKKMDISKLKDMPELKINKVPFKLPGPGPSFKEQLAKLSEFRDLEYLISVGKTAGGNITRHEGIKPDSPINIIETARCYDILRAQNLVLDCSFNYDEVQGSYCQFAPPFGITGEAKLSNDAADHWMLSYPTQELRKNFRVELRISKKTKLPEQKNVYDPKSNELLREYKYSDIELNANFPSDHFSLPASAKLVVIENRQEYGKAIVAPLKEKLDRSIAERTAEIQRLKTAKPVPLKRDPKTGLFLPPKFPSKPASMSKEEFDRLTDMIIGQVKPKEVPDAMWKKIVGTMKKNEPLNPKDFIGLAPQPPKAARGYGSVWLYLGVFFATSISIVFAVRFWRSR